VVVDRIAGRSGRAVAAATVALAGLHLWVTSRFTLLARSPADQFGYLANARWLSGHPHPHLLPELAYYGFGYSLFLVPAFWLFDDPALVTRAVLVVNAALMASLVPLLYAWCRQILDVAPTTALAAAVVGAMVPAPFYDASLALAENLILPLSVASVLACWLYLTPRPTWQRLLFAPATALLVATHDRFTFVVLWALAVMAGAAVRRRVPPRLAASTIALTVALLAGTRILRSILVSRLWAGGELATNQANRIPEYGRFFLNPTDLYRLLIEMVGHAWYLAVGTLGIAAIGVGALVGRLGIRPGRRPIGSAPSRLATVFLLGSGLVMFMTSSLYFSLNRFPSDGFIFGRYNEAFVPMWVAAGVALLLPEPPSPRSLARSVVVMGTVGGLALALVAGRDPDDLALFYTPFGVPDVARFRQPPAHLVGTATAAALLGLALVAVAGRYARARPWLLVALSVWLAAGGVTQVSAEADLGRWRLPDQVAALGVTRVAVATDSRLGAPPHYLFFMPRLEAEPWSDRDEEPPEPLVFDTLDSAGLRFRGGRVALLDEPVGLPFSSRAVALWVLPGPDQTRLDRQGRLLPAGFPASLPPAARRGALRLVGAAGDVRARPGGTVRVNVQGRHVGTGAPWPDANSYDRRGRVRVGAHPEGVGRSAAVPAATYAELPSWTYPGDRFEVTMRFRAVDGQGRPLPPGRYELSVDMEQVGYGWFSPPGKAPLRIGLVVT